MNTAKDAVEGAAALSRAIRDETEPDVEVVVAAQGTDLAQVSTWSREQIELVKTTICNAENLSDDEARLFIAQCQRLDLDPIAHQIHAIKRKGKLTIQIGIDGYRKIADRTGRYAGNDDPVFQTETVTVGEEGGISVGGDVPVKATVTVHKLVGEIATRPEFIPGEARPFTASARWAEYYPGEGSVGFMWRKMPFTMLGKCAEALALRKAFPAELGGFYIPEEMDQATEGETSQSEPNGRQERSQAPSRSSWEPPTGSFEELRDIASQIEVPFGDQKETYLGKFSQEHVDRLAKWCLARDDAFKAKYAKFMWAIGQLRTKTDAERDASDLQRDEVRVNGDVEEPPVREPGEEVGE